MFEGFPYTNFHELNLDWIIKIAKDFLDQYTNIQQTITQGLEDLDTKAQQLQAALDAWYEEHSEDIANQLADALQDLNDWYTQHQGYLDQYLTDSIAAFNTAAEAKAAETIASIPDDYTTLSNTVNDVKGALEDISGNDIINWTIGSYIKTDGTSVDIATPISNVAYAYSVIPCSPGDIITIKGLGASAARLWTFVSSTASPADNVIMRASANASADNLVLTAPENAAYLVLNAKVSNDYQAFKGTSIPIRENNINTIRETTENVALLDNGVYATTPYNVEVSFGEITISGTDSDIEVVNINKQFLPAGTYSAVLIPANDNAYSNRTRIVVKVVKAVDQDLIDNISNTASTFTLAADTLVLFNIHIGAHGVTSTFDNCVYKLQMNTGATIKPFTPAYSAYDFYARKDVDGLSNMAVHLNPLTFVNQDYNTSSKKPIRTLSSAMSDFLLPIYSGVKVIDNYYKYRVLVFDKNNNYVSRTGFLTYRDREIADYTFDFSQYNYRIAIRNTDETRAEDLTLYSQSVELYVDVEKLTSFYESVNINNVKDAAIEQNNNIVKQIMMRKDYDLRYANSARPLPLMNVYGNTQNVHPKVLYFPELFGGHRYWMAYTPYPYANVATENPCIAYSDDGYNFTNIENNPIDEPDSNDDNYYSDTHLVYANGVLECWYRYVEPDNEKIYRQTSSDGITWGNKELLHTSNAHSAVLCPMVIHDGSIYRIWVVNNGTKKVDYYESAAGNSWMLVRSITVGSFIYNSLTYYPWHGDVIIVNGTYVMVMMYKNESGDDAWISVVQTSSDNITYSQPEVILGAGSWDNVQYRISITKVEDVYRLYYSGIGRKSLNNGVYGIGISESNTLSEFIGVNY